MYDAEQDIRDYYRSTIKAINTELESLSKRDPRRNKLYSDRNLVVTKLATLSAATHQEPQGALKDYGTW